MKKFEKKLFFPFPNIVLQAPLENQKKKFGAQIQYLRVFERNIMILVYMFEIMMGLPIWIFSKNFHLSEGREIDTSKLWIATIADPTSVYEISFVIICALTRTICENFFNFFSDEPFLRP